MKRLVALLTLFALSLVLLTSCGGNENNTTPPTDNDNVNAPQDNDGDASADGSYTMRIPHAVAETHPSHVTLLEFKKTVEEGTGGAVKVEIIPNGALGGETQNAELIQMNSAEATVIGADAASGMVPELALIGAPYLFNSRTSAYAALDGAFGEKLAELAEPFNFYLAGWGDAGFRNVANSKHEIVKPDDLKGIKIRVMDNELHMALFREFGASPTPIAFNELFTALQQKTVDAQENPITVFTVSGFYEAQKYMTTTEHVYTAAPLIINKSWLESLPEEYQTVIKDAGAQWAMDQRAAMEGGEDAHMQTCKDNGMEIRVLTPEEKQVWMDAATVLDDLLIEKYGKDLLELARSFNQ